MNQVRANKKHKIWMAIGIGVFIGGSMFTFFYGRGLSYLSTEPSACGNCHIMNSQVSSWRKSTHHTVAVCVDCHLPTGFVEKYIAKADNGYRHSVAFTLQNFHEPIQIGERNAEILQNNCINCHSGLVHSITSAQGHYSEDISCVHCHQSVGHGEYVGLGKMPKN